MAQVISEEKEIFNYLVKSGCCKICAVRYLCNKTIDLGDVDAYLVKNDFIMKEVSEDEIGETPIKKSKMNPCIVCLGLLQDFSLDDILQSPDLLNVTNYDTMVFTCSISMPAAILVREHSMKIHVEDVFTKFYAEENAEAIPLNRAWKMFVKNKLSDHIKKKFEPSEVCSFFINVSMDYKFDKEELKALKEMQPKVFKERSVQHRKYNGEMFTRKCVLTTLADTPKGIFKLHSPVPPEIPSESLKCKEIECKHSSVYLAGRYCKYSRDLSQSPWFIDGVRAKESSVQEQIFEKICDMFRIPESNLKFSSSGREDVDVRCLGTGRPFYIEMMDPKRTVFSFEEFRTLEEKINTSPYIKVIHLQSVPRSELNNVKQGEDSKTKEYNALCRTKEPVTQEHIDKINNCGSVELEQKTPIRVLHRRPLAVRKKTVHEMRAEMVPDKPCLIDLKLTTQAGTYVKEFVHGDFGRTKPSLGDIIGIEIDIVALDVLAINLDWPKEVTYDKVEQ